MPSWQSPPSTHVRLTRGRSGLPEAIDRATTRAAAHALLPTSTLATEAATDGSPGSQPSRPQPWPRPPAPMTSTSSLLLRRAPSSSSTAAPGPRGVARPPRAAPACELRASAPACLSCAAAAPPQVSARSACSLRPRRRRPGRARCKQSSAGEATPTDAAKDSSSEDENEGEVLGGGGKSEGDGLGGFLRGLGCALSGARVCADTIAQQLEGAAAAAAAPEPAH
eukprot:scaffold2360_cov380-Prasinococcus_capsulatus_cf.AAC.18